MILDYSDHVSYTALADINNSVFNNSENIFFSKRGWCPFCLSTCELIDNYHEYNKPWMNSIYRIDTKVWQCKECGWWELKESERILDETHQNTFTHRLKHGVIKKYDVSSSALPLNVLRKELLKRKEVIYSIHHKKMEELVGAILSEFYECKVHYVGRTGDNGVDLILIENDSSTLVQVKRRMKPGASESVSEIREFLGAVQLHESEAKKAIFVTSAHKFTKPAVNAANEALNRDLVTRFDLLDFDKLISMMQIKNGNFTKPWSGLSQWL